MQAREAAGTNCREGQGRRASRSARGAGEGGSQEGKEKRSTCLARQLLHLLRDLN